MYFFVKCVLCGYNITVIWRTAYHITQASSRIYHQVPWLNLTQITLIGFVCIYVIYFIPFTRTDIFTLDKYQTWVLLYFYLYSRLTGKIWAQRNSSNKYLQFDRTGQSNNGRDVIMSDWWCEPMYAITMSYWWPLLWHW